MGGRDGRQALEGTALKVYAYILRNGPAGPRDVARALGLSSPSLAYYHLKRLEEEGLASRLPDGRYVITRPASVEGYVTIGKWLIPRLLTYSAFFAGLLAVEALTIALRLKGGEGIDPELIALTLTTALATLLFALEGTLLLRRR